MLSLKKQIIEKIESIANSKIESADSLSGGCISDAKKVGMKSGDIFLLKINERASDMFLKEANGLRELEKAAAVRVPKVIHAEEDFILTEFINSSPQKKNFFIEFGEKFSALHRYTSDSFGFYEDNYIGSTPQLNAAEEEEKNNWTIFYFNKRILYQFKLAEKNGYSSSELRKGIGNLESKIESILRGSEEAPSLLHGDLWGGNFITDEKGEPCLIDPAVYYGHREADLAMTKLFGGFSSQFYSAYNEAFPLPEGYDYRENIYKLYHVLNHLNLFGGSYYGQAIRLIKFY
jgi:protein-ribulosamine 3-kinase